MPVSGGGGGGASDVRTVSRSGPNTLDSRLLVAAGGGGGGGAVGNDGGNGGNAGAAGTNAGSGAAGGGAGTASAGGSCGQLCSGILGRGGDAMNSTGSDTAGGGGAGGLYGGGGGAAGMSSSGGGGGGSSFTGNATSASVSISTASVGAIRIFYGEGTPPEPTPGSDEGVVDATISMAESTICIELSTAAVDFGTGQFGQVGVPGTPEIVVTNCGVTTQALYARATNATASGASWDLVKNSATCGDTLGLDEYHLWLHENQTEDVDWGLGLSNTLLESVEVGSFGSFGPSIDTACPGSSGAGLQMSMQIVFTATEAAP
jgi:hypothetical protein